MEYDYEIRRLSQAFYERYPEEEYPELLKKGSRSYTCLIIEFKEDYLVCIPFRTDMRHANGFHFKGSKRAKKHASGLDYSKIVIIQNLDYLDDAKATVDQDEYHKLTKHIDTICKESSTYIDGYLLHQCGQHILDKNEYELRYKYTSLKYFHKELGIK